MKKETQLSVLKEIRDLLKVQQATPISPSSSHESDVWTLNVPKDMTIEKALAECMPLFPVWRWTDKNLDGEVTSDRTTKKAYTIKFKANIEAGEDMKNISVNNLRERGIQGITLLERILLELQYFKATSKHLDIENWTLCSGSRCSDGRVPCAYWCDGLFVVDWCLADYSYSFLRARVAVS